MLSSQLTLTWDSAPVFDILQSSTRGTVSSHVYDDPFTVICRSVNDQAYFNLGKIEVLDQDLDPVAGNLTVTRNQSMSSDSSAEGVFDQPFPKKSGNPSLLSRPAGIWAPQDDTPPSSYEDVKSAPRRKAANGLISTPGPLVVESTLYKSATQRRDFLMLKLIRDFPEYGRLMSQGRALNASQDDALSVHVFVDMSNILAGFHQSVKVSREIPGKTRIRRVPMSFTSLALILERGRVAAKRVLVGSDRLPLVNDAELLGYEANILDRVQIKPTSRRYKSSKARRSRPQMVEQAVDEILHLKICESLLDTAEPATMVLATGDGAKAEYSGGFMCQVERVLQRGWSVEVVSFKKGTSNVYRQKDFQKKWGQQFRLIELDGYVEELFE